jgi:putative toxin-antitoxin system antitoxin component (TIGR02293 family)
MVQSLYPQGKRSRDDRVIQRAKKTFGSLEKAMRWLNRPTALLQSRSPQSLLESEAGTRRVLDLLTKIEHGIGTR